MTGMISNPAAWLIAARVSGAKRRQLDTSHLWCVADGNRTGPEGVIKGTLLGITSNDICAWKRVSDPACRRSDGTMESAGASYVGKNTHLVYAGSSLLTRLLAKVSLRKISARMVSTASTEKSGNGSVTQMSPNSHAGSPRLAKEC